MHLEWQMLYIFNIDEMYSKTANRLVIGSEQPRSHTTNRKFNDNNYLFYKRYD